MENTIKKTKAMYFAELREIVSTTVTDEAKRDELVAFIDKQVDTLDKRKVAAAERAERKRAESDALTDTILSLITDELKTVDELVMALNKADPDAEIKRNMVTARLGKLVKAGNVAKEYVKVEGNKRMAYRLTTDADTVELDVEADDE